MGHTYCCVSGCKNNTKYNHLSFFGLPRDKQRLKTWLKLIRRPDLLNYKGKPSSHRVCSIHFESHMFKNRRLLPDAVPSRRLPTPWRSSASSSSTNSAVGNDEAVPSHSNYHLQDYTQTKYRGLENRSSLSEDDSELSPYIPNLCIQRIKYSSSSSPVDGVVDKEIQVDFGDMIQVVHVKKNRTKRETKCIEVQTDLECLCKTCH